MSDEKAKSGVAPTKSAKPNAGQKANAAKADQVKADSAKKKGPTPKKPDRIPMYAQVQTANKYANDEKFHYRWCADYGKGKHSKYLAAGYEFVKDDEGQNVMRPGGEPLYLMRLPMELYEQDQLAKREKIINMNKDIQQKNAPKGGAVPEYIPKGADSVLARDDL